MKMLFPIAPFHNDHRFLAGLGTVCKCAGDVVLTRGTLQPMLGWEFVACVDVLLAFYDTDQSPTRSGCGARTRQRERPPYPYLILPYCTISCAGNDHITSHHSRLGEWTIHYFKTHCLLADGIHKQFVYP